MDNQFEPQSRLLKFSNILIIISVLALVVLLIVIVPYIINFSGNLSPIHEHWAEFGDYFGGFLNPLLGFVTIIVLILTLGISFETLRLTKEELKQAREILENTKQELSLNRDTAKKQIENVEKESLKNELLDIIKLVDIEITKVFQRPAYFSNLVHNFGYYFSFSATRSSKEEIPTNHEYNFTENDRVAIDDLCDLIQQMDSYMHQYDTFFGTSSPRTYFFKRKHLRLYSRLLEKKFITKQRFKAFQNVGYIWAGPSKNS